MLNGISASHGIGIGSICVIEEYDLTYEAVKIEDTEKEQKRCYLAMRMQGEL